jgi:hypothetical protein
MAASQSDPVKPARSGGRPKRATLLAAAAFALAAILAVPSVNEPLLRGIGWALVVDDALARADVIVVSLDSSGAGALEAADLVQSGIASRVAVFTDPPSADDHEFIRRGLPYENLSERQIRQLKSLGVKDIVIIPEPFLGSTSAGEALPQWCEQNQVRSVVFVSARDHSRRLRRMLERDMRGHSIRVSVRPSHYSRFDPDRWWQTRGGRRTFVFEWQKLLLDYIVNPTLF